MGLKRLQVVIIAAFRFFDVCASLVKRERKMIQRHHNIASRVDFFIGCVLKALCSTKQEMCSLDEAHGSYFDRGSKRTDSIGSRRDQNASVTSLREIFLDERNIISVIKN